MASTKIASIPKKTGCAPIIKIVKTGGHRNNRAKTRTMMLIKTITIISASQIRSPGRVLPRFPTRATTNPPISMWLRSARQSAPLPRHRRGVSPMEPSLLSERINAAMSSPFKRPSPGPQRSPGAPSKLKKLPGLFVLPFCKKGETPTPAHCDCQTSRRSAVEQRWLMLCASDPVQYGNVPHGQLSRRRQGG